MASVLDNMMYSQIHKPYILRFFTMYQFFSEMKNRRILHMIFFIRKVTVIKKQKFFSGIFTFVFCMQSALIKSDVKG